MQFTKYKIPSDFVLQAEPPKPVSDGSTFQIRMDGFDDISDDTRAQVRADIERMVSNAVQKNKEIIREKGKGQDVLEICLSGLRLQPDVEESLKRELTEYAKVKGLGNLNSSGTE